MSSIAPTAIESVSELPSQDYGFTFTPTSRRVRARIDGVDIADTRAAMVLTETRLPPVYYLPRGDVRMDLMESSTQRTLCPFKGNASYWHLALPGRRIENVMWSYDDPVPEASNIAGYVAFYADLLDELLIDEEAAAAQPPDVHAHDNPLLGWLLRDAPLIKDSRALTGALAHELRRVGIPLWRLAVIIRTLHPQLNALAYRWWLKDDSTEEIRVPYEVLLQPQFLNSPLKPVFEGAGGVRRRLDIKNPVLDYGILEDLQKEGATDYVAMPMTFSDGQINVVTVSADRPGGFTTSDLGHIHEILPVMASIYEVHAMRYRAATLLDTYLGHHAGSRVLDGLIKRGDGESIQAVIWFCDLRGSTPLAESLGREAFLELLNEYFDAMAGAVLDNGGHVLRYIGDAALAIFPIEAGEANAHEAALAAADEAGRRMTEINATRQQRGLPLIDYGVALHPGEVTYGNIGTQNRLEFTVIGNAANTAARIESLCKKLKRNVLVSGGFAERFPERFESLGCHPLRGVGEDLEIFALSPQSAARESP